VSLDRERMPVMDGHEAIRRIRAMPGGKDPKVVAVTASAMDEHRQELMAIGADDFIGRITPCLSPPQPVILQLADRRLSQGKRS